MAEDGKIYPSKRQRVDSDEEYQQIINSKDRVIDELRSEVDALKKRLDEIINARHGSSLMNTLVSDDELETMKPVPSKKNAKKQKKKKKNKSPAAGAIVLGQAKAGAGIEGGADCDGDLPDDISDMSTIESIPVADGKPAANMTEVPGCSGAMQKKTEKSKSIKVPVVTTFNINVKYMSEIINSTLGHTNYNMKVLGKNATNIGVCTLADFDKLKILLRDHGVNYYTYTPKGERPMSVVIEGLSGTYSHDDVMGYLEGLHIRNSILGLVKLNGDRWLLRLSRDTDVAAFCDVRYILHCRVNIRKYRRGAITQCFNCQRFGHVSTNCQMPYRCVKCGESHGPGNCEIPAKDDNTGETVSTDPVTGQAVRRVGLPVKCVNCGIEGHVASSRECPRRVELLRKVQDRRTTRGGNGQQRQGNVQLRQSAGNVKPGMSYASAVTSNVSRVSSVAFTGAASTVHGPTVADSLSQFDFVDKDCRRFFGGGLLQCIGKIGGFAREYRGLKDDESKSRALLGMLMTLQNNG